MVFQNVYLFHDTVRNNICFGKPDATAILKAAPIIILDEATASIDPENEHLIQNAITIRFLW